VSCYNSLKFEKKRTIEFCKCTEEDYECDYGFERKGINEPCAAIAHSSEEEQNKPPEHCHGYYNISRGYRKVPGNQCRGGVQNDPILVPCSTSIFSLLSIFVFMILISIVVYIIYTFSDSFKSNFFGNGLFQSKNPDNDNFRNKKDIEHVINFPEDDDNVLFDDKENPDKGHDHDIKEMEDIKKDLKLTQKHLLKNK